MKKALYLCVPYFLFWFFIYHIDKFISSLGMIDSVHFVINFLLLVYCFLCPFVIGGYLLQEIKTLLFNYKSFTVDKIKVPLIYLSSLVACYYCFNRLKLSSEMFESPIVYNGFSKRSTYNLRLKLRHNHRFEENNSSLNLSVFSYGSWKKNSDTIFLKKDLNTKKGRDILPDTLILSNGYLIPASDIGNSDTKSLGLKLE